MIGNLSFFLGGKTAEDGHRWSPNLEAVRGSDQIDQASAADDGTLNIWRIWPSSRPVVGTSEAMWRGVGIGEVGGPQGQKSEKQCKDI
ncbi:hypothetical protein FOZG_18121 [Fusarium oxysporum Fo47]|uniref:Uncharacterized protein n=1 Tax=Fusarium oxysporum Fo47 TaxID=660027 RepID=W9J7Z2_FUSOX|nr:hypothetical protein FOZG_18121 [Fusarium oxysporum Fo47]